MGHLEEKLDLALDYLQFCLQGNGCFDCLENGNQISGGYVECVQCLYPNTNFFSIHRRLKYQKTFSDNVLRQLTLTLRSNLALVHC